MHTYLLHAGKKKLWTVFFWKSGASQWLKLKEFDSEEEAAAYTNYLNGGSGELPK